MKILIVAIICFLFSMIQSFAQTSKPGKFIRNQEMRFNFSVLQKAKEVRGEVEFEIIIKDGISTTSQSCPMGLPNNKPYIYILTITNLSTVEKIISLNTTFIHGKSLGGGASRGGAALFGQMFNLLPGESKIFKEEDDCADNLGFDYMTLIVNIEDGKAITGKLIVEDDLLEPFYDRDNARQFCGFKNRKTGEIVISPIYMWIYGGFSEGLCCVVETFEANQLLFINAKGITVLKIYGKFEANANGYKFVNGKAKLYKHTSKYGGDLYCIDKNGNEVSCD